MSPLESPRKQVPSCDTKSNVEEDVMDIMLSSRRKVGGKRIHVNVPSSSMGIVFVHSKASVQKWKYVFQRKGYFLVLV